MTAVPRPTERRQPAHRAWVPRQHGAWAMLLLPILLGIAASRPSPWQLVLGGTAVTAYLASASIQAWSRARRPAALRAPIVMYGGVALVLGGALIVAFPALLLSLVVVLPGAVVVLAGARPGTRRDLANSLGQVAQALVLVPAAAYVSGEVDAWRIAAYTLVAAGYLVGTVLVVRSVLRERGNARFAALSVGFHVSLVVLAAVALPLPYTLLAVGLTARAAALPLVARRAVGGRPLRPIHVGMVEIVGSLAVVAVAFAVPIMG